MRLLSVTTTLILLASSTLAQQATESNLALADPLLRFVEVGTAAAEAERNAQDVRAEHGPTCDEKDTIEAGWLAAAGTSDTNVLAANTAMIEMRAACQAIADAEIEALDLLKIAQRSFHLALADSVDGEIAENLADLRTADANVNVRVDAQDGQLADLVTRLTALESLAQRVEAFCDTNSEVSLCRAAD